jgi:hypothetical protein
VIAGAGVAVGQCPTDWDFGDNHGGALGDNPARLLAAPGFDRALYGA